MTPNQLMRAVGVLIEEVATPRYDCDTADEQPITREQWDELDERWRAIYVMNRPRVEAKDEQHHSNA